MQVIATENFSNFQIKTNPGQKNKGVPNSEQRKTRVGF